MNLFTSQALNGMFRAELPINIFVLLKINIFTLKMTAVIVTYRYLDWKIQKLLSLQDVKLWYWTCASPVPLITTSGLYT